MEFNSYIKDKSFLTQKETLMKNSLILISLSTVSLANSAEALECSKNNINEEQAVECAGEFLGKANDLYDIAQEKGHLDDVSKCASYTSEDGGSYFTENKEEFINATQAASVENCTLARDKADQYVCYIKSGPDACYIPKGSNGESTNRFLMKIGKTFAKLITFYPIKK